MTTLLPLPTNITVETTAYCQLRCPACPTPVGLGRARGFFSTDLFEQLLSQVTWPLNGISFGWSGEPLMNRNLPALIAAANAAGVETYVSTNGLLLERDAEALLDAGLTVIRVCIDGINQEMAAKYRVGTDFAQVIRGVEKLIGRRQARGGRLPYTSLQMLVTRQTEEHLDDFIALGTRCGVDEVYFKSFNIQLSEWLTEPQRQALAAEFLPSNPRFLRYTRDAAGQWVIRPELRATQCPEVTSGVTILHTGEVVPCCEDFTGAHILGNIRHQTLAEIWEGERYRKLRTCVQARELSLCRGCTYPGSQHYNQVVPIHLGR